LTETSSRNAAARAIDAIGAMGSVAEFGEGRAVGLDSWARVAPDPATITIAISTPMHDAMGAPLSRTR
jgi:hypothetical protein